MVAAGTGHDAATIQGMLDSPEVTEAYERDRAEARTAGGTAAELQGKTAQTDGLVRYTAPSVLFDRGDIELNAGGFQPIEAYDVIVANLNPELDRRAVPDDAGELLDAFPLGLTTQEVALLLTRSNDAPDPVGAELAMLELVGEGKAARVALGDSAVWARPDHIGWMAAVLAEAQDVRELEPAA